MGNFFRFAERDTNFRTEMIAGLTTFMTMAYIIFVNPSILGTEGTGLQISGVFFATCVAAAIACIAMGLFGEFPSGVGLRPRIERDSGLHPDSGPRPEMAGGDGGRGPRRATRNLARAHEPAGSGLERDTYVAQVRHSGRHWPVHRVYRAQKRRARGAGPVHLPGTRRPHPGTGGAHGLRARGYSGARRPGSSGWDHHRHIADGGRRHDLRRRAAAGGHRGLHFRHLHHRRRGYSPSRTYSRSP